MCARNLAGRSTTHVMAHGTGVVFLFRVGRGVRLCYAPAIRAGRAAPRLWHMGHTGKGASAISSRGSTILLQCLHSFAPAKMFSVQCGQARSRLPAEGVAGKTLGVSVAGWAAIKLTISRDKGPNTMPPKNQPIALRPLDEAMAAAPAPQISHTTTHSIIAPFLPPISQKICQRLCNYAKRH